MAIFTAWHRIAGVKLHHSLNHVLCYPEFMPPPIYRCGHPAGHPKLLQLETPLPAVRTVQTYCTFMRSNVQLITPLYCAMYQLTRTLGMKNLSLFSGLLCRVGVFTQYDTTEHDSYITETHACIRTSVITNCVK